MMTQDIQTPPLLVGLNAKTGILSLTWHDGVPVQMTSAYLRTSCRCAYCRAAQMEERFDPDPAVKVTEVLLFGVAGLQLVFSDGHRRGIFPWRYLRELGSQAG